MGSYVVFGMEQPGSFLIAEISPEIPAQYFVLGGCAAALALILVIRSLLRRRKTKRKSAVQTGKHML